MRPRWEAQVATRQEWAACLVLTISSCFQCLSYPSRLFSFLSVNAIGFWSLAPECVSQTKRYCSTIYMHLWCRFSLLMRREWEIKNSALNYRRSYYDFWKTLLLCKAETKALQDWWHFYLPVKPVRTCQTSWRSDDEISIFWRKLCKGCGQRLLLSVTAPETRILLNLNILKCSQHSPMFSTFSNVINHWQCFQQSPIFSTFLNVLNTKIGHDTSPYHSEMQKNGLFRTWC